MLYIFIYIPFIGVFIMGIMNKEKLVKRLCLIITYFIFIYSIFIYIQFDHSYIGYQNTYEFTLNNYINLNMGLDGLSLFFVILTTFIFPICVITSWDNVKYSQKFFFINLLVLECFLIYVFIFIDIFLFYIFFESVLIPLFIIVGLWGSSLITRTRASFILFLYTLLGSLFILLSFVIIINYIGTTEFIFINLINLNLISQIYLWLPIFFSLAIKTPLIPIHIWLYRAHGEAPCAASVVLAALVLKLATYGYIRILLPILPNASIYFIPLIQLISIITILYSALSTLRQTDIKQLVAYSSVAHIAVVVGGLFSNNIQGIQGAILLSLAHGFVSGAIFILVGGILYDRFHNRTLIYFKGLSLTMPIFSSILFIFILANIGTPLTVNWLGEFLAIFGLFYNNWFSGIIISFSIILSAAFSIWFYIRLIGGSSSLYLPYHKDISRRELISLLPLLFFTIFLGIYPNFILEVLHISTSRLLILI